MIKQRFLFVPMFYVSLVKNFVMDSLKLFPEKTVLKLFPEELRILNIHNRLYTWARLSHDLEKVTGFGRSSEGGSDMVIEDGRTEAGVIVLEDTERPLLASRSSEAVIM